MVIENGRLILFFLEYSKCFNQKTEKEVHTSRLGEGKKIKGVLSNLT